MFFGNNICKWHSAHLSSLSSLKNILAECFCNEYLTMCLLESIETIEVVLKNLCQSNSFLNYSFLLPKRQLTSIIDSPV